MTLTEAAAYLRRSYIQVLRLVLIGKLEGWQESGRWKVRRSAVERLVRESSPLRQAGENGVGGAKHNT